jgi:FtsH-binding integral membrane protein
MNYEFQGRSLSGRSGVEDRVAFLRSVYLWLMGGFVVAGLGAIASPFIAAGLLPLTGRFFPWALFLAQFGALIWASAVSRRKPLNKVAYGVFTFTSGVIIGIVSLVTIQTAGLGTVVAAFGMTAADFLLLTVIAFVSKKDFSFLRSFVAIGIGIMFFGSLIGAIFHLETLGLMAAGVAVIACSAKILYDTSNMLRSEDLSDPAGFALSLFVSLYNILLSLMRLLSGRRN